MLKVDWLRIIRDLVWFGWWYCPEIGVWYRYTYHHHWTIISTKKSWKENYGRHIDE